MLCRVPEVSPTETHFHKHQSLSAALSKDASTRQKRQCRMLDAGRAQGPLCGSNACLHPMHFQTRLPIGKAVLATQSCVQGCRGSEGTHCTQGMLSSPSQHSDKQCWLLLSDKQCCPAGVARQHGMLANLNQGNLAGKLAHLLFLQRKHLVGSSVPDGTHTVGSATITVHKATNEGHLKVVFRFSAVAFLSPVLNKIWLRIHSAPPCGKWAAMR